MGYTTEFKGSFKLNQQLEEHHHEYLKMFSETRRMKRDPNKITKLDDLHNDRCYQLLRACELPFGAEGEYYCGTGCFGQDNGTSIVDYNNPPASQPGLWCKWVPNKTGNKIKWSGAEKFYDYVEWLQYLLDHFLIPWGYVLNGKVKWQGEDSDDIGYIIVVDNVITVKTKNENE